MWPKLNSSMTDMKRLFTRTSARWPLVLVAALTAALVGARVGVGAPPSLKQQEAQKRAQAQAVLAQVDALNIQLNRADEQINGARYRLGQIRASQAKTRIAVDQARKQYRIAEGRAASRLVAVYETNAPTSVDAILGATTVNAILDRVEAVNATTALDHQIAQRLTATRTRLASQARKLEEDRHQQAAAVDDLQRNRAVIRVGLAHKQRLLESVKSQVATIQARERVEQQRLLVLARARLAAEAAARAKAAALARQRAAAVAATAAAAAKAAAAKAAAQARAHAAAAATTTVATTTTTASTLPAPTTTTDGSIAPATTTDATDTTTAPGTTASAPVPAPILPGGHPEAASIALRYLGIPYLWGGGTPAGFDCSGLVMYVYAQLGISLPHYAAAQFGFGTPLTRDQLQPGDLVFFDGLDHVGIWIGGGQFVDAPHTGSFVKIETFGGWYATHYVGARRI
jgi:peptidoglycan DL-endopeptidase CwlO